MKQFLFLLTFLFVLVFAKGQAPDSTAGSTPVSWKKYHIGIRAAAGIQRSFYTELGLSWQIYAYDARRGFAVNCFYIAFEWIPASSGGNPIYGVKAGVESVFNGGAGGFEIKYLFNDESEDLVITPKLGFGLGIVNLFYGYNISTKKEPFPKIGKHQVSLVINSSMVFHHKKYDK